MCLPETDIVLCFNGEIYGPREVSTIHLPYSFDNQQHFDVDESDTSVLYDLLSRCETMNDLVDVLLAGLNGPWSVIVYQVRGLH